MQLDRIDVDVDGKVEKWLLMFKNETTIIQRK